jgi:hypothetical protein
MKNCHCKDCISFKNCRDSAASWIFLFIGLLATLAVRVVNLVTSFGPFWPKLSWYVGVGGFFIYFLYKFRQDRAISRQLQKSDLNRRLTNKENLTEEDNAFLKATICRLRSKKDSINYFFIFFSSILALIIGIYQDFLALK